MRNFSELFKSDSLRREYENTIFSPIASDLQSVFSVFFDNIQKSYSESSSKITQQLTERYTQLQNTIIQLQFNVNQNIITNSSVNTSNLDMASTPTASSALAALSSLSHQHPPSASSSLSSLSSSSSQSYTDLLHLQKRSDALLLDSSYYHNLKSIQDHAQSAILKSLSLESFSVGISSLLLLDYLKFCSVSSFLTVINPPLAIGGAAILGVAGLYTFPLLRSRLIKESRKNIEKLEKEIIENFEKSYEKQGLEVNIKELEHLMKNYKRYVENEEKILNDIDIQIRQYKEEMKRLEREVYKVTQPQQHQGQQEQKSTNQ